MPVRTEAIPAPTAALRARGLGVLVIGHGTADPLGAAEAAATATLVAGTLPATAVELSYLEVIGPTIEEGLRKLLAAGCREIVAAPLLLFSAGHATQDVPDALAESSSRLPLSIVQTRPLGCHPRLLHLSAIRRRQAIESVGACDGAEVLLFLGRGSSAVDALDQLRSFARLSLEAESQGTRPPSVVPGFVAAARPTLDEAVDFAVKAAPRRIVVQPHLLFHGHVDDVIARRFDRARRDHPHIEWCLADRLGADEHVAAALVDRIREAAVTLPAVVR